MKKSVIILASTLVLLSSCGTYSGSGAYVGGSFGSILGSAIGGLAGGPRGSDLGTIVGMVGGAAVGAAVGNAADQQVTKRNEQRRERIRQSQSRNPVFSDDTYSYDSSVTNKTTSNVCGSIDSGFDSSNSGDDRLYDFNGSDYTGNYSVEHPTTSFPSASIRVDEISGAKFAYSPSLEIVNARFVDGNQDNKLSRNEICKIIFEIMNRSDQPVYDVVPTVVEITGNKHIYISPNIHVEKIVPGRGIRYTAMVKADSRLKDGVAKFCVSVLHEDRAISKVNEFTIMTSKN